MGKWGLELALNLLDKKRGDYVEIGCRVFVHSEGNRGASSSKGSADAGGFSSLQIQDIQ